MKPRRGWVVSSLAAATLISMGCSDNAPLTAPMLRPASLVASGPARPVTLPATPVTLVFVGNPDSIRRVERVLVPTVKDASPAGWLYGDASYSSLVGNNAEVVRDIDGYRPHVQHFDFRFPFANAYARGGDPYQDSDPVEAQAFYWVNVAHDYAWTHGFNEQAGSWQDDRLGRGGPQNHRILVRLQAGVSDALYVGNGTIVMGLMPYADLPWRDTGLDVDELVHEYFHAIWEQLFGSEPATDPQHSVAAALTESMADYYGATITGDPVFGEYLSRNPVTGEDSYRLDGNPQTFAGWACGEPHRAGEVWSATLWDIRGALGQDAADDRIIRGLVLARHPATFITIRDGILGADSILGQRYSDVLWRIFAARGFGWSSFITGCGNLGAGFDVPPRLAWQLVGPLGGPMIMSGADTTLSVTMRNTGTVEWSSTGAASVMPSDSGAKYALARGPVAVTYHWLDSTGAVMVSNGLRTPLPSTVPPGGSATLSAIVRPPAAPGQYLLEWGLVQSSMFGSETWFPQAGAAPRVQRIFVQRRNNWLARWVSHATPDTADAADSVTAHVLVVNEGSQPWPAARANPVLVSYHWADSLGRVLAGDGLRTPLPHDVAPGDSVDVEARVAMPAGPGRYRLVWDMVAEGVTWFGWQHSPTPRNSVSVRPRLRVTWVSADTAAAQVPPGETTKVVVTFRNVGPDTLHATGSQPVKVGYHWLDPQGGAVVWDGMHSALPADIPPGGTASVAVQVARPSRADVPELEIDLVVEGVYWLSWVGQSTLTIPVRTPAARSVGWLGVPQALSTTPSEAVNAPLVVTNTGSMRWPAGGSNPVQIRYRLRTPSGAALSLTGDPGALPRDVAPGDTVSVNLSLPAGIAPGLYLVEWDLFDAVSGWFSWSGAATGVTRLTVLPGPF